MNKNLNVTTYPRTGKRGVPQQFPRRLYKMLQSESGNPSHNIIKWSESGGAFQIADISTFSSLVLPMYFKTSKFSSFQRNLNLYGFSKVRKGPDTNMYRHPAFLRGRPELLSQLKKSTQSADKVRHCKSASLDKEEVIQCVREEVEKCDKEMTVRMVSPCSSQFTALETERYYHKSITPPSINVRDKNSLTQEDSILSFPKENGRLALLAIVMAHVTEQDSMANTIGTNCEFRLKNLNTHVKLQHK